MDAWGHVGHGAAWVAGAALVLWSAVAIARALGLDGLVRTLLACAVLSCAQVVLAIEALSLLRQVRPWPLLGLHAAVAAALIAAGARPAPLPFRAARDGLLRATRGLALRVLLGGVAVSAVALLALVYLVPPNNHDGLTYHMTRVALWLQQGSLDAVARPDLRTTILPANAELLVLWQAVLLRHDVTAGLVQWLSWAGAMLAAYGVGREAGLPERRAAFGALAFGALPAAVLQATSVQNDLTAAFFAAAALYFASHAHDGAWPDAALAGAAFGLALGTKPTVLLTLPCVALFLAARWRSSGGAWPWRVWTRLAAAALAGTALLGSYVYVQNVRRFGSPSGPEAFRSLMSPTQHAPRDWWSNGGRLALLMLDPGGSLPPDTRAADLLVRGYLRLTDAWFRTLNVERVLPSDFVRIGWRRQERPIVHEDLAVFGTFYGGALALAAAWALVRPRADLRMRALGAGVVLYVAGVAVLLRFQPFHGRLLLAAAAFGAPLLGGLFREAPGRRSAAVNLGLAAIGLSSLATCVLYNDRKPLLGPGAIWRFGDRLALMRTGRPGLETLVRLLDSLPAGRLAVLQLQPDTAVYPLFGDHLDRPVEFVHVGHLPVLTSRALPDADYLLVAGEIQAFYVEGPSLATDLPFVDWRDLTALRRELAAPGSGWTPVVSGAIYGEPYLLFARGVDRDAAAARLPVALSAQPPVDHGGAVPPRFEVPVLLDAARPTLVLSGWPLAEALPFVIEARLASGEVLARFEASSADRFAMRIPLERAMAADRSWYTNVTIASTHGGAHAPAAWSRAAFKLRAR
jgi:hypothetical protein